ncbi:MAG: hypothetical protein ACYTGO_03580 [Planctomycetota bacterium]|jgi:hypothetical protein
MKETAHPTPTPVPIESDSHRPLILSLLTILGVLVMALVVWQWGFAGGVVDANGSGSLFGPGPADPEKSGPRTMQGDVGDADLDAVSTEPDRYWQREAYATEYPSLKPFRKPTGYDQKLLPNRRWPPFWDDIRRLHGMRKGAPADKISFDENGREIVDTSAWRETLERVRINNLKLDGHVAQVLRDSASLQLRQDAYYGIFYFDDIQNVFDLTAQLCAEPHRPTRLEGFARTLRFLAVHLPKSVPIKPSIEKSPVRPKYKFNAWGYLQLVRMENNPREQAEGLRFLTDVLRIRHDLGRAYLVELRDMIPKLLSSRSTAVRQEAVSFLTVIDRKKHGAPKGSADASELLAWYGDIAYELLPPVEHVSTGRTILHPSKDLDDIIKVGSRVLQQGKIGTIKLIPFKNSTRRGLEIQRLPRPLHLLGIPKGALITNVNTEVITSSQHLLECLRKGVEAHKKHVEEVKERRNKKERPGDEKAPIRPLVFQVWYVHKGKELCKDFHVVQ